MKREQRQSIICLLLIAIILAINTINVFTLIGNRNGGEEMTQGTVETTDIQVETTESDMNIQVEATEELYPQKGKIKLSTEEFEEFCILGTAEFALEPLEGQIAGFATILNRWLESSEHPDSLHGVIHQPYQFSAVRDGNIYIWENGSYVVAQFEDVSETTILAAQLALEGEDPTEQLLRDEAERQAEKGVIKPKDIEKYSEGGALFFYNPDYCSAAALESREAIKVKVKIGNHVFYKYWDLPEE